jgi:TrkA domain protein
MTEVRETPLPGVGIRYDFVTRAGTRLGVLVHHGGRRSLLVYSVDDPDACRATVELDGEDALTLAELLGAAHIGAALAAMQQEVQGLAIDWLSVAPSSPAVGRSLAELAVHTRTGVSVVAVLRGTETIPAPGAETRLEGGDTIVGVGTAEGMQRLYALLESG